MDQKIWFFQLIKLPTNTTVNQNIDFLKIPMESLISIYPSLLVLFEVDRTPSGILQYHTMKKYIHNTSCWLYSTQCVGFLHQR